MRAQLEKLGAAIGEKHRERAETSELGDEFESMTSDLSRMHNEKNTLGRQLGSLLGKNRETRQEVPCVPVVAEC